MKKLLSLLALALSIQFNYAQKHDPRTDQFNFVPGKIIVKLKDNVDTNVKYSAKGVGTTQMDIGALLGIQKKVKKTDVLFSEKSIQKSVARKSSKKRDLRVPNPHSLKNTFVLELNDKAENILGLVEELKKNVNVEYAEPDYNYSVNDFTIDSDIIYPKKNTKVNNTSKTTISVNDPLYPQQTNITATNIDKVWDTYTTGDGSQIIAILDTGIDYTHPDLAANIWTNEAELNGVAGFDDDANGYIDDIRGWDFINLDNAPLDDNMHGTHVAGIAGAVGNNGIGIAGAAWNVKLMPIKVFQSNGVGNTSTIAQGVTYAANNGATILNMSFGSYAESITLRNALENAYAISVLVAAAGNDALCIGPERCPDGFIGVPLYPGAYTFVIGVQDAALYSNYDQDGPIFSKYSNLLNYEVKAPGSGIMSTVPNGGYRTLTGTSMSTPLVAGGIALYLQQKPTDSKELLFGNLINTASNYVDILAAIDAVPTPQLKVLSAITKDTINGQNGNGYLEPNETIEIFPLIKNYWGPTDDVRVGIEFAEFEDTSKATIIDSIISIGSVSAYATLQDLTKSLKIKIAPNVANNVNIKFNLKVWFGSNTDYLTSTEFVINVKNSILLYGVINYDLTLYANKEYLVSDNLILSGNATLTIKPGTTINIADDKKISLINNSRMIAKGTKDSLVVFQNEDNYWVGLNFRSLNENKSILEFSEIKGINPPSGGHTIHGFYGGENVLAKNILMSDCSLFRLLAFGSAFTIEDSNFYYNDVYSISYLSGLVNSNSTNLNFINNSRSNREWRGAIPLGIECDVISEQNIKINIFDNEISLSAETEQNNSPINAYLGTSDLSKYRKEVNDIVNYSQFSGFVNLDSISPVPYEANHAIVWKVLVDGKDAQDEYELMDPVGVGTHTFDVYFNRAMDTNYPPQISYGVREPYTQKIISETGTWSPDGKIYSVTHEVKIGAADGINRIRVSGARDLDYFDIPIEDSRFNMLVQSAGSASAGFLATPGLGEITLDWEVPDSTLLEDVLGYNMYRYEAITDSTYTESTKINTNLITDNQLVDYNVEEGKRYYYQYKILRTSFDETDFSKTVATQPLTSMLGDSNGDFDVNVMDLVQDVDYILGNNPTPFILKAADVNNDTAVNVLDIVGTVDIILNPSSGKIATKGSNSIVYYDNTPKGDAIFYWEGDDLYVESKEAIAGLQLAFDKDFTYSISKDLPKFEWLNYQQDNQQIMMMYSFGDVTITAGKTKLLTKTSTSEVSFDIDKAVVAATKGLKLNAIYKEGSVLSIEAPIQTDQTDIFIMSPNPTNGLLNISYYLPEKMDKVQMSAYSIQGQKVWVSDVFKNTSGHTDTSIDLSSLNDGIYFLVVDVIRSGGVKKREVKQIILVK
ncbi:MAG: S8 family serine peptidase [Flavobacteriaceae bacterium]|nr:S8 family serine peptidase [Flavobacteriaceae bacterium]